MEPPGFEPGLSERQAQTLPLDQQTISGGEGEFLPDYLNGLLEQI
jgi:hypothetical protein